MASASSTVLPVPSRRRRSLPRSRWEPLTSGSTPGSTSTSGLRESRTFPSVCAFVLLVSVTRTGQREQALHPGHTRQRCNLQGTADRERLHRINSQFVLNDNVTLCTVMRVFFQTSVVCLCCHFLAAYLALAGLNLLAKISDKIHHFTALNSVHLRELG